MVFFKEFLKNAKQIGSIIPSSRFLSKAIVSKIDYHNAKVIVELGAGTGVFTEKLIINSNPDTKLFVFEINESLYKNLQNNFSCKKNVYIINASAENLNEALALYGVHKVDYVLSGLPFLNFSPQTRNCIFQNIHNCLERELILFQYTPFLEHKFKSFYSIRSFENIYRNFPPAKIYTLTKKTPCGDKFLKPLQPPNW